MLQSRPDLAHMVSYLARIQKVSFSVKHVQMYNDAVVRLCATKDLGLFHPHLDVRMLRVVCVIEARLNEKDKGDAQLGFLVLLAHHSDQCCIIQCS